MAHKGPTIRADYGYALPVRLEADASLDLTGETIAMRIGLPGAPSDEPLVTADLTAISSRAATGTIAASALRLTPGEYAYVVSVGSGEARTAVSAGAFFVVQSVLGP